MTTGITDYIHFEDEWEDDMRGEYQEMVAREQEAMDRETDFVPFLTVSNLADAKLGRTAETGEDFAEAGFAIMGGCQNCHATIACYNAYPSYSGYWRCEDCIGGDGFLNVAEFEQWQKNQQEPSYGETAPVSLEATDTHLIISSNGDIIFMWLWEEIKADRETANAMATWLKLAIRGKEYFWREYVRWQEADGHLVDLHCVN